MMSMILQESKLSILLSKKVCFHAMGNVSKIIILLSNGWTASRPGSRSVYLRICRSLVMCSATLAPLLNLNSRPAIAFSWQVFEFFFGLYCRVYCSIALKKPSSSSSSKGWPSSSGSPSLRTSIQISLGRPCSKERHCANHTPSGFSS